ncbi:hypothetical protein PMAA_004070 [Talaromyces marneffei ATCC 18224]|uniref:Uncharacterized protein n=1 Tax=Talaromyces marneffei (strain ATCC 18224 / CBS 334.59 / QM 7333) TaxID=441960 RepID=B6QT75_TALMQ|nr:hypothetical protein PMAA_004070 [Talaromyces marneffei ATCC 18224]
MSTMTPKKKKPGHKRRGLETTSESSEPLPTESSSSSISSPHPRSTTLSATSSTASSHPSYSTSNIRPDFQAHPQPDSQAHSHPTSSGRTPSPSARHFASRCVAPCCSGSKSSSSSSRAHPSSDSRSARYVSQNPLLPSFPPGSRLPKTMTKRKSKSSRRGKAEVASVAPAIPASKTTLGEISSDKDLRDFHHQLQICNMELHPGNWLVEAFPTAIRPLLEGGAPELVKVDGATKLHVVMLKPVPLDVIQNDIVWDYNVAPHCRFTYLDVQQTLVLNIATETRMMETLPESELIFDDTDMGVQGHALGRFKYGLKKQLSGMGIIDNRWEFACSKSRQSHGLTTDPNDPAQDKAIHSVDRMFVPGIIRHPKYDANNEPWPTMVVECGPEYANVAARWYLNYCVDWWFTQSTGFTKIVLLMYFDYDRYETIVEKWVCAPEAPYTKSLAQTININLQRNKDGKAIVVVNGEDLIINFESLMARPKREGESDIVFDKALMNGFGNGYLVPWPNLGTERRKNVKSSGIDVNTARKLLNYPLETLKDQLGPALTEALKAAEKAAKAAGADADVQKSKMKLTLTRNKVKKEGEEEKESVFGEDRIPVDISIPEALAIMAEKDDGEEDGKEEK